MTKSAHIAQQPKVSRRRVPLYQAAKYVAVLPALALTLVLTPAPTTAVQQETLAGGLSKRFMRFNDYLFNGTESGTAIVSTDHQNQAHPSV